MLQGVLIINLIFYLDFAVFSVFATLLITELMGAVLMLITFKGARKSVLSYVVPIWEVTGTFGAFWVVVTDFAFPSILTPAAHIFAVGFMLFLILLVARNSTIVFAEYIIKKGWLDERKLYLGYSLSTVVLGLIVLVILSAIISGAGVDLGAGTLSIVGYISSPGSLMFIAGALLIGLGLAPVFYNIKGFRFLSIPATAIGVGISVAGYALYSTALLTPYLVIPVVLTMAVPLLYYTKVGAAIVTNKLLFIVVASIILFTLNPLVYPSAFGRSVSVDAITTTGPMAGAFITITLVGLPLLAVMIGVYILMVRRSQKSGMNTTD